MALFVYWALLTERIAIKTFGFLSIPPPFIEPPFFLVTKCLLCQVYTSISQLCKSWSQLGTEHMLFDFTCKDLWFYNHIWVQPQTIVWPPHFLNASDTFVSGFFNSVITLLKKPDTLSPFTVEFNWIDVHN